MCSTYRRVTSLGRLLTFFGVEPHRDCLGIEAGAHHDLAMKAQSGRHGLEAAEQLQLVGRGECFGLQLYTATTGFDASLTLTIAMPMTTTTISSINRTVVERIVEVCSASDRQTKGAMRTQSSRQVFPKSAIDCVAEVSSFRTEINPDWPLFNHSKSHSSGYTV